MFKKERNLHNGPFDTRTIQRIVNRFLETGSVADRTRSGRPDPSEEMIEAVDKARERIQNCAALGNSSTRRISNEVDIPKTTVNRVLRKKMNLYPYKLHCGQTLSREQQERRVQFAEWLLDNDGQLEDIICRDEAHFELNGSVNRQSMAMVNRQW